MQTIQTMLIYTTDMSDACCLAYALTQTEGTIIYNSRVNHFIDGTDHVVIVETELNVVNMPF